MTPGDARAADMRPHANVDVSEAAVEGRNRGPQKFGDVTPSDARAADTDALKLTGSLAEAADEATQRQRAFA